MYAIFQDTKKGKKLIKSGFTSAGEVWAQVKPNQYFDEMEE
ncbi:MAG: hypothetical protein AABY15_04825 [Nanoarchaeota archaeon]